MVLKIIGENIRQQRLQQNISQEELAFRAGVHRTYIGSVERGEKNVTILTLKKIADALKSSINNLIIGI